MTELHIQALTGGLEHYFREVARTRMRDMPIINSALQVEAVGFERGPQGILGVLVTPWFISLVLLPDEGDDWRELALGSECSQVFDSGHYRFLVAGDEATGRYQTCSLLSPVLEIADQQAAVALAEAALDALHDRQHHDSESGTRTAELVRHWRDDDAPIAGDDMPSAAVTMSRRAFLGGRAQRHKGHAE